MQDQFDTVDPSFLDLRTYSRDSSTSQRRPSSSYSNENIEYPHPEPGLLSQGFRGYGTHETWNENPFSEEALYQLGTVSSSSP